MIPMGNLWLTEAVDREFRVDRVTFVDGDKLPRVRRRLGLGVPVSELKKTIRGRDFFGSSGAFAVVRQGGDPEDVARRCLELVREEAAILTASQLGYSNRGQMRPVVPVGEDWGPRIQYLAVSSRDGTRFSGAKRTSPLGEVILDGRWKGYQDGVFFTRLLKILRGETEVENGWRDELRRALVMIGESVGANDLLKSFVWNMVALEMLLTRQDQERTRDALPKRAEALLGWVGYWEPENYEDRIGRTYGKRNALLHGGKRDDITEQDLAFTDHLLLNLLLNLAGNPKLFGSKEDVVGFSKRVEAERVLGTRPRVRPRNLRFVRRFRPDF